MLAGREIMAAAHAGVIEYLRFPRGVEIVMGSADQFHAGFERFFVIHQGRDIAAFWRPAMRSRFAFGKHPLLNIRRQPNIAMAMAVDVNGLLDLWINGPVWYCLRLQLLCPPACDPLSICFSKIAG